MGLTSVNSGFDLGVFAVGKASRSVVSNTSRLSSGERITRAGDDVSGLSISARLQTRITSLRTASMNVAQAESLLQVMDGGLQKIDEMLQRMQALSVQSNSGSLTSAERGFLNQEFQQLMNEIDRIAQETTFGNLRPLADLSGNMAELDDSLGNKYEAVLTFNSNWGGNNRFIRLGTFDTAPNERFFWRNNTAAGNPDFNIQNVPSLEGKLQNLVNFWNDPTSIAMTDDRFNKVTMELISPNQIKVTARSRGDLAQYFPIADDRSHNNIQNSMDVLGTPFIRNGAGTLFDYVLSETTDGSDTGLEMGSTTVISKSSSSGLFTQVSQEASEIRISINNLTGGINNNNQIRIDNGFNGAIQFRFRNVAVNPVNHIQIGADNIETLNNAVTFFNEVQQLENVFSVNQWLMLSQLEFERDGLDLVIRSRTPGLLVDLFGNGVNVRDTIAGGFVNNGVATGNNLNMVDGVDTGVNATGITNKDFVGTIQGFEVNYLGGNRVEAKITVGDATYRANIFDTSPTANTRVSFLSQEHGYFHVDLAAGAGMDVNSQADADKYAAYLDKAFDGLIFSQARNLTSYKDTAVDGLQGTAFKIKREDFSEPIVIEDFTVRANEVGNGSARLEMVINGETYISTKDIDRDIEAYSKIEMVSLETAGRSVIFENGANAFTVTTTEQAQDFEDDIKQALGIGSSSGSIGFQVGQNSTESINVSLADARVESIFENQDIDILTQESAQAAFDQVQSTIDKITQIRSQVGSEQSRIGYASDNIQSAFNNQLSAHSVISDTDITFESTQYALNLVQLNSSIGMLAQVNGLRENIMQNVFDPLSVLGPRLALQGEG